MPPPASASRWSRWERSPPDWLTRSTTRAAAILRSVEALQAACEYMLAALVSLAEDGVSAEQFIALDRLRLELEGREVVDDGSIATADREEAIGDWMEDRAIDHAWSMAAVFASVGVEQEWFDRLEAMVGSRRPRTGAALGVEHARFGDLMSEIVEATNRIGHLVQDVKSYSQMDRSALQVVDIHDGIESTLTMLRGKLGQIELVRDFQSDLPPIEVYASSSTRCGPT